MTGKTHILGGMALGTLYSMNMGLEVKETAITICITTLGALIPDFDSTTSKLGRLFPIISIPANKIFGHRGLLHYPLFYLILGYLGLKLFREHEFYIYPMLLGIFSHLILDILNPLGIPLFTPKGKKINLLNIYTGSMSENVVALLIVIATTVYITKIHYNII